MELARANPRYGFRRVHALLPGVNVKAVHRIWRAEGLGIRHRKRRKLVVKKTEGPVLTGPNQAWCLDFAHERLENGRHARILGVLDCFTRECLLLKTASTFPAFAVERELDWLYLVHGKPRAIVSDNGPEFRAMTLPEGVSNQFIQPGKPWQNGYIESFFGKLRDELLSCELFMRGADLQAALADFQDHYNNHRHPSWTGRADSRGLQAEVTINPGGGNSLFLGWKPIGDRSLRFPSLWGLDVS